MFNVPDYLDEDEGGGERECHLDAQDGVGRVVEPPHLRQGHVRVEAGAGVAVPEVHPSLST